MTTARRLIALLSALFLIPLIAVTIATNTASAADSLFSPLDGFTVGKSTDVRVRPKEFSAYRVDLDAMRAQLSSGGPASVTIPDPAGTPTTFTVVEDSVMEPELQAAHPEIRTYTGADARGNSIRLDVTPMGFHAFVRRTDGVTWLVDPAYNRRGEDRVLSYPGGSSARTGTFVEREFDQAVKSVASAGDLAAPGDLVSERTYRMAFLTDNTYATYFGSANVFSEKTTMMNRVNEVYNDDLAIKFVLITGTDTKLNLDTVAKMTGINGPCGASACYSAAQVDNCGGDTLTRNFFAIGQIMGAENFDIGHIGLGNAGGGIAGLGVVGGTNKARGCTGLPTPDGDLYAIDYVAHEVGHQMGGNHTFNSSVCAGNRNGPTSVEPGSGSSVMAYAGICGADNLQPHSDPYFSERSVDEIRNTTSAGSSNLNERQSVAFLGLDNGEQFTLSCTACPTSLTITAGSPTFSADVATAVQTVTGQVGTVTGYDGGAVGLNGVTVNWAVTANIPTLTVQTVSGTFTPIVGTIINGGPTTQGGAVAVSANNSPTVTAPAAKTIPMRTPFALTGSALDSNGDTLTYMWEQNDAGSTASSLPSNTKTSGPLFRQFGTAAIVSATDTLEYHSPGENLAGTSPTRSFPDMTQVLAGNTNAATGSCPAVPPAGQTTVDCFSEFLPTVDYTGGVPGTKAMHFRLTARDEFAADPAVDHPGGLSSADVTVTVDSSVGPFQVTSRATAGAPASGAEMVTWDVNGTATPAFAENVKISLSTDSGLNFSEVVASTPNDGSQLIPLPNITTVGNTARIKVEAVGNYFFDVNDANFAIVPAGSNVAPTVNAGPDGTATTGSPFTSSGSYTDDVPATVTATVNYGDGSGVQALTLNTVAHTFALNHTYATAGTKTVTVEVTDAGALTATDTATVTVTTVSQPPGPTPSATDASAKPKKITKGHKFKVQATVTTTPGVPAGTVQVYLGTKLLGTGTLKSDGKVTIKIPEKKAKKLKVGKNTLTVKYLGSATVAASQGTCVIKVKP